LWATAYNWIPTDQPAQYKNEVRMISEL
jgi:hypothetical protein